MTNPNELVDPVDVVIVGAGIMGLAHAALAVDRGLTVAVIERDEHAVGASVRNFGHCCITGQTGVLYDLAMNGRRHWLDYAGKAEFTAIESGALVVARSGTELQVLRELAGSREPGQVALLAADDVARHLQADGRRTDPRIVGGAFLRDDLRVDPRTTVHRLAGWLAEQGVIFHWRTSALEFANGTVHTSRGTVLGSQVIVCVGHDLDYLFPEAAAGHGIERCTLQMSRALPAAGLDLGPAVLTGTSMLRYGAFASMPSAELLRIGADPSLQQIGANVMFTQQPDGSLLLGDSHSYQHTAEPFLAEPVTDRLNQEISALLGMELAVTERWQGVYASSDAGPLFVEEVRPGVTAVSVTSGVGMTISFGLAERTLESMYPTELYLNQSVLVRKT